MAEQATMAETAEMASPSSQHFFNMSQKYAIINEQGGWLENLVVWNGDTSTWQPPAGTYAVLVSEIDLSALPQKPQEDEEGQP